VTKYLLDESTSWEPEMLAADIRERSSFKIFASTEFSTYSLQYRQKRVSNWGYSAIYDTLADYSSLSVPRLSPFITDVIASLDFLFFLKENLYLDKNHLNLCNWVMFIPFDNNWTLLTHSPASSNGLLLELQIARIFLVRVVKISNR
jgi:hypothetical protein